MKQPNLLSSTPTPVRLHIQDFKRVHITLVGCGGTGSHIASGLVALQCALADKGIPLDLLVIDPDIVEPKNVGRQLFALGDIGRPKAQVVADRLNAAFGARVGAEVRKIDREDTFVVKEALSIVIGAVDNPAARSVIARAVKTAGGALWWLDAGNENHSGQVALGNVAAAKDLQGAVALGMLDRLPCPTLVYPDLVKRPRAKRSTKKQSCAELTASGEQSLMINRLIAAYACALLYDFLVAREVRYFAVAVEANWAGTRAYTLDVPTLAQVTGLGADQLVTRAKHTNKCSL